VQYSLNLQNARCNNKDTGNTVPSTGHFFILHDRVFRNVRKDLTYEELIVGLKEFTNVVESNAAVTFSVFDCEQEIVQSNCDGK
jgi:hypothetical protein